MVETSRGICGDKEGDDGVTGAQIVMACGAPQLNKMRGFITDALLKREAVAPAANGHTVYKLALTPRGTAKVAKVAAAPVEGVAAAKVAKPRKAKVVKVDLPAPVAPVQVDPVAAELPVQV